MSALTDNFNIECDELRRLPTVGGAAIMVGYFFYLKEVKNRRRQSIDTPEWKDLEVYDTNKSKS